MGEPVLRVGLVGARGYVGAELFRLFDTHPVFELAYVSSRELAGQPVAGQYRGVSSRLRFEALDPAQAVERAVDAIVLALPNGRASAFVEQVETRSPATTVVDLSADFRFDEGWYYGLPELTRSGYRGQRRISNPGCYATAMQLLVAPLQGELDGPVQCFGVSGYSGAGTTRSQRNDPSLLRDNLMPYALVGHLHEREVCSRLDHAIEFMPHVAPHFRGLMVTANLRLRRRWTMEALSGHYRERYRDEPLVDVVDAPPWVSGIAHRHHCEVGGLTLSDDGRRLVAVAVLDNLLKGAATQALQNLNRAFDLPETTGVPP